MNNKTFAISPRLSLSLVCLYESSMSLVANVPGLLHNTYAPQSPSKVKDKVHKALKLWILVYFDKASSSVLRWLFFNVI